MEKYGTIPKRFTKEWWEHYWEYYKLHTIVAVCIIAIVVTTVVQVLTQTKTDCVITVAGSTPIPEEKIEFLCDRISEVIQDCDENGKKVATLQDISLRKDAMQSPEYVITISQKLMLELSAGDGFLYIYDRNAAKEQLAMDDADAIYLPVDVWAKNSYEGASLLNIADTAYAVTLKDSKLFAELGIDSSDYYLMIRAVRRDETDDKKAEKMYESAISAANLLLDK